MSQNAEKQIKKMIESYATKKNNIILAERLFVAKSVLLWAIKNSKTQEIYKSYLYEIERHLNNEITLYWEDDKIKIRKEKIG